VTIAAIRQRNAAEPLNLELLADRYAKCEAVIAVVGLGYVGLPLALCAYEAGFRVIGLDVSSNSMPGGVRCGTLGMQRSLLLVARIGSRPLRTGWARARRTRC
jgi:hypothetical protein